MGKITFSSVFPLIYLQLIESKAPLSDRLHSPTISFVILLRLPCTFILVLFSISLPLFIYL